MTHWYQIVYAVGLLLLVVGVAYLVIGRYLSSKRSAQSGFSLSQRQHVMLDPSLLLGSEVLSKTMHMVRSFAHVEEETAAFEWYYPASLENMMLEPEGPSIPRLARAYGVTEDYLGEVAQALKSNRDVLKPFAPPKQEWKTRHEEVFREFMQMADGDSELASVFFEEWIFVYSHSWIA